MNWNNIVSDITKKAADIVSAKEEAIEKMRQERLAQIQTQREILENLITPALEDKEFEAALRAADYNIRVEQTGGTFLIEGGGTLPYVDGVALALNRGRKLPAQLNWNGSNDYSILTFKVNSKNVSVSLLLKNTKSSGAELITLEDISKEYINQKMRLLLEGHGA
jgi:hypothetical protein